MKAYQVRRTSVSLGLFNERELRALLQKGKLQASDEVDEGAGKWRPLGDFMASLPAPASSGSSSGSRPSPTSQSAASPGLHFYLHSGGSRVGPLELSKINGMARAGMIDASAMLEDVSAPGSLVPVASHVALAAPTAAPAVVTPPVATAPAYTPSTTSPAPVTIAPAKQKATYLELWWKTTLWIYGIGALFGYLSGNLNGLIGAMVIGVVFAPVKGAFWAWIIWLFKR